MQRWLMFYERKGKFLKDIKYRISDEDAYYYYLGNFKVEKSLENHKYITGRIENAN